MTPKEGMAVPEGFRLPVGYRSAGPLEASMQSHAAAVRARLRGMAPAPFVLRLPKPVALEEPEQPAAPPPPPLRLTTSKGRALVVEVAQAHGLNWRELVGPGRTQRLVMPRNEVAFRLITELHMMSYPKAGRVLGDRDHTTILHACRRHATTSPEAAEIWRKHVECETEHREHKREMAHRLHSHGLPVKAIAARLHVVPGVVSRWIS